MDVYCEMSSSSSSSSPLNEILSHPWNQNILTQGVEDAVSWKRKKDGKIIKYPGITRKIAKLIPPTFKRGRGYSSMKQGAKVHRDFYHTIECEKKGKCDCSPPPRRKSKMFTLGWKLLGKMGLKPIAAEVPLIYHPWRKATRLDMICEKDGKQYVISLKTGGEKVVKEQGKFLFPFQNTPCTSHNIAQLQSCAELVLLDHYGVEFSGYFILYVTPKGASLKRLESWVKKNMEEMDFFMERG